MLLSCRILRHSRQICARCKAMPKRHSHRQRLSDLGRLCSPWRGMATQLKGQPTANSCMCTTKLPAILGGLCVLSG